ncbi:major facilitator superfamily domain-containing protein [Xylariaceae sp. FL0255]|nr:major facilitator superfamily domain-containing protein [Xylariaceae sp. FL0255]
MSSSPSNTVETSPVGDEKTRSTSNSVATGPAIEELLADLKSNTVIPEDAVDPVYAHKAAVLNRAIKDIGMGRYQWSLFWVIGFGWWSDNMWPVVTSLIFTPIKKEFNPAEPTFLSLAQNIGLLVGAVFWGFGCDVFGRRWAFNLTLGLTATWGLIAAGSPNFAAIGTFAALWSFGVGGNLPVDSAIFLEFLPATHQYLLTVLSIDWAVAQVIANLIAQPFLTKYTCSITATTCTKQENIGWRYFIITIGAITLLMFIVRFFFFTIYESPKYLMGKGRDEEAVKVVHEVARRNKTESWLTVEHLKACETEGYESRTTASDAIKRKLQTVNLTHVRSLFRTKKLGYSTAALMIVWAFIGLAFPLYNAFLPYIQAIRGADFGDGSTYLTYRNNLIIAVLGVPGAALGAVLSEIPYIGRKGALSIATVLTGVFLFASTTATNSEALLGWNSAYSFTSNIMYAVLYAFTPEVFPTKDRGTGNALTATSNRIFGVFSPIIATYANLNTPAPVYTSGALFIIAGVIVLTLPFESRGKASL